MHIRVGNKEVPGRSVRVRSDSADQSKAPQGFDLRQGGRRGGSMSHRAEERLVEGGIRVARRDSLSPNGLFVKKIHRKHLASSA